jgi:glucose dehydrogenase
MAPPGRRQRAPARTAGRGNVPGEWRYWGGDAWSTRYSPLDQINANELRLARGQAWQWNAGTFGADEYYRTTPLYANGRLFTVATTRRVAMAIDPETGETLWMWRLDEGHPLAEGAAPVRRPRPHVLDGRQHRSA